MRRSTVFFESFLDGFTLRGLPTKLERPGAATQLFASSENEDMTPVSEELRELRQRLEAQQAEIDALKATRDKSLTHLAHEIDVLRSAVELVSKTNHGSR